MLNFRFVCRFNTFFQNFNILQCHVVHYSTVTSTNASYAKYFVDSLGFSHHQALSVSTKLCVRRKNKVVDSDFLENAHSVVTLFRNLGFHESHLRRIVSKEPCLLASNVDRTLKPKIRALHDENFSRSHVIRVISSCPTILLYGLESTILPLVRSLRQVMGSVSNVVDTMERLTEAFLRDMVKCLLPNVALLNSYGIPIELIRKHIVYQPRCYVQNPKVFKDVVMKVEKKLGITRDSPMFLHGINLISGRNEETINSKCRVFKSFGWTQFDIQTFIMKCASCSTFSDERFQKKLDVLMNQLHLKPAYLSSDNHFITCSPEIRKHKVLLILKTMVPRHKILLILKESGQLKKNLSIYNAVEMSEPCFLKRFVLPFKEVHETYAKFSGCSLRMLTQESQEITSTTDSYANYLANSLRFSLEQSLSISTMLTHRRNYKVNDSKFVANANSVVALFHNHGFDETLIKKIVSKEPRFLASNVDKTLKPRIKFLQDEDFSASDIIRVVSCYPEILWFRLESTCLPVIHILKQVMGSVANVVPAFERFSKRHFRAKVRCLFSNVTLLSTYGVPIELIRKQILSKPNCYVRNPEVFKDMVMRVEKKLGITRDSPMFLYGMDLLSGISEEKFESKCQIFKSFGWTQCDVETFIVKNARCLTFSDERVGFGDLKSKSQNGLLVSLSHIAYEAKEGCFLSYIRKALVICFNRQTI